VYSRIGFESEYVVERWHFGGFESAGPSLAGEEKIVSLSGQDLDDLQTLDEPVFGASRKRLLNWYLDRSSVSFGYRSSGALRGFVLGRPGENAYQIGPLVAENPTVARSLLRKAFNMVSGEAIIVDIPRANPQTAPLLEEFRFERKRILNRMFRGKNRNPGQPDKVYCLAGFEFG
jgi:hypothetical protein